MKKLFVYFFILGAALLTSCQKNTSCLKGSGPIETYTLQVEPFDSIFNFGAITLLLEQGAEYKIEVSGPENILPNIEHFVSNNSLTLKDNSGCNLVNINNETQIKVTAPNLTLIRHFSHKNLISVGTLSYDTLKLAVNANNLGGGTGNVHLTVNCNMFNVESNSVAQFFINGYANRSYVGFQGGSPKFLGENFEVEIFQFFQRSASNIVCKPNQVLRGDLYGTGNVISLQTPSLVEVTQHHTGTLILNP